MNQAINSLLTYTTIFVFSLGFFLVISSCGDKDTIESPSQILLSNTSIYERLPAQSVATGLTTNVSNPMITYSLVSGDGDTHNEDFKITGYSLRTNKTFNFSEGTSKNIRLQVSDGVSSYEEAFTIQIQEFAGTYPSVTSPSFLHDEEMPKSFGADHGNVSPGLNIMDVPDNTISMAIMMVDLDFGNSIHWAVWNIPPTKTTIGQNESWGGDIIEGGTNYGIGYTGPFPPSLHRYEISVYFLTENINLTPSKFTNLQVEMAGKTIAQASIIGKYR